MIRRSRSFKQTNNGSVFTTLLTLFAHIYITPCAPSSPRCFISFFCTPTSTKKPNADRHVSALCIPQNLFSEDACLAFLSSFQNQPHAHDEQRIEPSISETSASLVARPKAFRKTTVCCPEIRSRLKMAIDATHGSAFLSKDSFPKQIPYFHMSSPQGDAGSKKQQ
jgi:hypothetical protein